MLVFVFIKCKFNSHLLASVNISLQVFPVPTQEGEKGYFLFLLNKCLTRETRLKIQYRQMFCKHVSRLRFQRLSALSEK